MNKEQTRRYFVKYKGDTRYEKVWKTMQLLGIEDITTERQSRNGNKYAKLEVSDELGFINGMLLDTARQTKLTEYLNQNDNKLPKKELLPLKSAHGIFTSFFPFLHTASALQQVAQYAHPAAPNKSKEPHNKLTPKVHPDPTANKYPP